MIKYLTIRVGQKNNQLVDFGIPDTQAELDEMYKLRLRVYLNHNYLPNHYVTDKDEYEEKSIYFIASMDSEIIGSLRLIVNDPLPTEVDCFQFDEPEEIKKIPRGMRGEVSRLVVEKSSGNFLPRHLVMLGLIKSLIVYCQTNNIQGGYGFIKDTLKKKLDALGLPVQYISVFKSIYNKEALRNYFNDPNNIVWPIYYLTNQVNNYIDSVFNNKFLFKRSGSQEFVAKIFFWELFCFMRRVGYGR